MAKGNVIRALLRMKHSPAGKKYLASKKKWVRKKNSSFTDKLSIEQRLRDAGIDQKTIDRMKGKKKP